MHLPQRLGQAYAPLVQPLASSSMDGRVSMLKLQLELFEDGWQAVDKYIPHLHGFDFLKQPQIGYPVAFGKGFHPHQEMPWYFKRCLKLKTHNQTCTIAPMLIAATIPENAQANGKKSLCS